MSLALLLLASFSELQRHLFSLINSYVVSGEWTSSVGGVATVSPP